MVDAIVQLIVATTPKLYVSLAAGMCRLGNGRVDGVFFIRHTRWTKEQAGD
jgi:hypothetical protein